MSGFSLALAISCCAVLLGANAQVPDRQSSYGFFAKRSRSVYYTTRNRWFEISDNYWRTAGGPGGSSGQFFLFPSTAFRNGRYTAPKTGLYYISSMLRFDSIAGVQEHRIVVNSNYNGNRGLSAYETTTYNYNTMGVTAVIFMNAGDYISLWFYTSDSNGYYLQGESGFSAYYLGTLWSRVGFNGDLSSDMAMTGGSFRIGGSRLQANSQNAWINSPGGNFNPSLGRLTAPCAGIYFASANIRLKLSSTYSRNSYYRLYIVLNGRTDINNGLHSIQDYRRSGSSFSIHVSGSFYLAKGGYVEIYVTSSSDRRWTVGSSSGITMVYLSRNAQFASGFLADATADTGVSSNGAWTRLTSWRTAGPSGAYQQNPYRSFSGGRFYASEDGYYLVNANIRVDGRDSSSYQRILITVNGKLDVNNGMQSLRGYYYTARYYTLHATGVVYLAKGNYVDLYMQSPGSGSRVQSESGFSMALLGPQLPSLGFHVDTKSNARGARGWYELKSFDTTYTYLTGIYQADNSFSATTGRYTVQIAGIYYVGANVRIDSATVNETRIMIAKNGQTSDVSALSVMESASSVQRATTISLTGFMKLDQGDYVSVFAYSGDTSWTISSYSSFSAARIGSAGVTDSFLADMSSSMAVPAAKYTPLGNFNTVSKTNIGLFQSTYTFAPTTGTFTAPRNGLYYFSANVRFDNAQPLTTFRIVVGKVGAPQATSGLRMSRDLSSSYKPGSFSESVSGPLYLAANDQVQVWVYASKASSSVSTETSFSGSFIGQTSLSGFMMNPKSDQTVNRNARSFSATPVPSTKVGSFRTGFTLSSGYFTVPYAGTYLISANVKLTGLSTGTSYTLQMFINNNNNANNGFYSVFQAPSSSYGVSMFGSSLLAKGQTISFYLLSGDTSYVIKSESTFSAVLLPNTPYHPSSFLADVTSRQQVRNTAWNTVKGLLFGANQISRQRGMHSTGLGTLSSSTGLYTVKEAGLYWVSATVTFQALGGKYLQVAIAINGKVNYDSGTSAYYGNPIGGYQTIHLSALLDLAIGNTLSIQYLSFDDRDYYLLSESSFGAYLLGKSRPSFRTDLVNTIGVKQSGVVKPGNWGTYTATTGITSAAFQNTTGVFTASFDGMYVFAANIRIDGADASTIEAKFVVNDQQDIQSPISYAKSGTVGRTYAHLPLAGVLNLKTGDNVALQINSVSDKAYQINTQSGMSMVYLIHPSAAQGFIAQPSTLLTYGAGWRTVYDRWVTTDPYSFNSGHFDERAGRFFTTTPGLFFIAFNLRIVGITGGSIKAAIMIDGCVPSTSSSCPNGLFAQKEYVQDASQPNTLLASGVMALSAFRKIELRLYCSKTCQVMKESSWTVVFAGTQENAECNNGGPVLTTQPTEQYVQAGHPATLTCRGHSAPDPPTYQWLRTGVVIPGATSPSYVIASAGVLDNTYFACRVAANGRTFTSWNTQVRVISHDGEEPGFAVQDLTSSFSNGYRTISTWSVPSGYSFFNNAGINTGSGYFTAPKEGVYIVSANIYMYSLSASYSQIFLSYGGSSTWNNVPVAALPFTKYSDRTLSFSTAIYMRLSNTISVRAYNPTDRSWFTNTYSSFSARYIGTGGEVPGVYAVTNSRTPSFKKGWTEMKSMSTPTFWDRQWITGQGFSSVTGRYTASCDGIYYASSNVRILKQGTGYMRLVLAVNGGGGIDDLSGPAPTNQYFSLNSVGTFSLKKGNYLSVRVYCDVCSSWTADAADLSVVYLGPVSTSQPGLRAQKSGSLRRGTGWTTVTAWTVANPATGLYSTVGSAFNAPTGVFTVSVAGIYFVAANMRIDQNCDGFFRMVVDVNNRRDDKSPNNLFRAGGQCQYNTMKASGLVKLEVGNTVRVNIYSQTDKLWYVNPESYLTIQLMERINPSFHADQAGLKGVRTTGWFEIKGWLTKPGSNNGLYQSGTEFNPTSGRFTAGADGIYFTSALIRLDQADVGFFQLSIAVNNKPSSSNGISDYESYITTANEYYTLSATGFVRLRAGDVVSVYVYASKDTSYNVYGENGFSVNFVGHYVDVPSFLASVSAPVLYTVVGKSMYEITSYTTTGPSALFESGGSVLNNGRFVAPVDGNYFAAANIHITPVLKGAIIYVRLAVNSQFSNASTMYQATRGLPWLGTFTDTVNGAFRMKAGDYLSVFVGCATSTKLTVGTQSSFSAALLGSPTIASLGAAQTTARTMSRTGTQYLTSFTDTFNYISKGAATGVYVVPQSGWYYIAFNVMYSGVSGGYIRAGIALNRNADINNGLHAIRGQPSNGPFTLAGAGTARLRKGQSISVYVYSNTDPIYTAQGSLSVTAVGSAQLLPALSAISTNRGIRMSGWANAAGLWVGHGSTTWFSSGNNLLQTGSFFVAPFSGIYAVFGTADFSSVITDIFRLMVTVNGQRLPDNGMQSTYSSVPSSVLTMSVGGSIMLSAGDKIELVQFSNTDTSYTARAYYLSATFISFANAGVGFSADKTADMVVLKSPKKFVTIADWQTLPTSSISHGLFASPNTVIVAGAYTVPRSGIYLIHGQIRVDNADTGYFTIQCTLNGVTSTRTGLSAIKTGSTYKQAFTQNLAGAVYLKKGSTLRVDVMADTDTSYTISSSSGISGSWVAPLGQVEAVHATLSTDLVIKGTSYRSITGWSTMKGVEPFIDSPFFDPTYGYFTAHTAGFYYVSVSIRFERVNSGWIAARLNRIGFLGTGQILQSNRQSVSKSTDVGSNTIVFSLVIRLNKFDKLQTLVYSSSDSDYTLDQESSFSVVFVGGSQPQRCPISGVRVINNPALRQRIAIGDPASVWITAVSDLIVSYQWYLNNRALTGATKSYYNITKASYASRGNYRCRVTDGTAVEFSNYGNVDVYQTTPQWGSTNYRASMYENLATGVNVATVYAWVEDEFHQRSTTSYKVTGGANSGYFALNANSGRLSVAKRIDREAISSFTLSLLATNKANGTKTATSRITVIVLDRNDNAPMCTKSLYTYTVTENSPKGTIVGGISATDRDIGVNAQYRFSITGGNSQGYFALDSATRNVLVNKPIDRETIAAVTLTLTVKNVVSGPTSSCRMRVNVVDVNDNSPTFKPASYNVSESEASKVGTIFAVVTATDPDFGTNGLVTYSMASVTPSASGLFSINSKSGQLSLANTLDYDTIKLYSIVVTASDSAASPRSTTTRVTVNVLDANDNRPVFTLHNYYASVVENATAGQSLVTVLATDKDPGAMSYWLMAGGDSSAFAVNSATGLITTAAPLDREYRDPYILQVLARDQASPPQTGTATVSIDVIDINDNTPQFAHSTYVFQISETAAAGTALGQVVATDSDDGSNGMVAYSLSSTTAFSIQSTTGVLELETSLDFSVKKSYSLTVSATDGGTPAKASSATITITVKDANTNPPLFSAMTYTKTIPENAAAGTTIATVLATDPDPGPTGLTYSIVHGAMGKFAVNAKTGVVTLTGAVDYEAQPGYELVVRCQDSFATNAMSSVTFVLVQLTDINDSPPVFTPSSLSLTVNSLASPGSWLLNATATDADTGRNALITYTKGSGSYLNVTTTGVVTVGLPLPQEGSFSETIIASNTGTSALKATLTLTIGVVTPQQNPIFTLSQYTIFVSENTAPMSTLVSPRAVLPGGDGSGELVYALAAGTPSQFSINAKSGDVILAASLDRESTPAYTITVTATYQPEGVATSLVGSTKVVITVTDFNDNAPVFNKGLANTVFTVSQSDIAGTQIGRVMASDVDSGSNAKITFGIISGGDGVIRIDPYTGTLYTSDILNPLQQAQYAVVISATNMVLYPRQSNISVTVNVVDENDHKPTFVQSTYTYHMKESVAVPSPIGAVTATDQDSGALGTVTYSFVQPAPAGFSLDRTTGAITLTASLDREMSDHVTFQITATDGAPKPLSDTCSVYVYVDDVNDNAPKFSQATYTALAGAATSPGTGVVAVAATDADAGSFGTAGITYSILSGDPSNRFQITSAGVVEVLHLLSQLTTSKYTLTVQASDGGTPAMTAIATVVVTVLPTSATAPVFEHTSYAVVQSDTVAAGSVLFTAKATGNGVIAYSLSGTGLPFSVNASNGAVQATSVLNADRQAVYALTIVAADAYGQRATMHLTVTLQHVNEHAPVFNPVNASATVSEAAALGTVVVTVRATDMDVGSDGAITYSLAAAGPFAISPQSGVIELEQSLDRETRSLYTVVAVAMDQGTPPQMAQTFVTITVGDVNDNPPVFPFMLYNGTVGENLPAGTFVVRPFALDNDLNPTLSYRLTNPNAYFTINPLTGAITTLQPLDREGTKQYDLTVQVNDGLHTALCQVDIEVVDANDNGPVFSPRLYTATVNANADIGTTIAQVEATDMDYGSNADILYTLPDLAELQGFIGISDTGLITLIDGPIVAVNTEFTVTIVATDVLNYTLKDTATLQLAVTGLVINVVTEAQVGPVASTFSTPQIIGIVIGGAALLILIIILVIVIKRKPKRKAPASFSDGVQYNSGGEAIISGAGFQNPMYAAADGDSESVKQNPMYTEDPGHEEDTYDTVGMFSDRAPVIN